ncbi:MAG: 4Fe-4S binding protein [Cyanobacteria bacterium J06649_5]
MLSTLSERKLHAIRWGIFLAWALLIASLFYDPVSALLTHPNTHWSPLADQTIARATIPTDCVSTQGYCIPLKPYAIGTRVFWGMVVPSAIFVVLVFGHEFWRRLCPLYFFSQLPRALGLQPLLTIDHNQWLKQNHFYVQFTLFFLGLNARILFVNSVRPLAAVMFILTLLAAASTVALYGGRSWCHYVCPFGMVQTVFTGPRGLLDSQAHKAAPYSLTQSMCRTTLPKAQATPNNAQQNGEQSACISCKSACMDIDAEYAYWAQLHQPGRQLVQYGYLGLVIGYFSYYALYAGNFGYYFSGVWSHEPVSMMTLLGDGFYVFNQAIPIPKLFAAPLTLAAFAAASCWLCTRLERLYRGHLKHHSADATAEESLHKIFSLCTFVAFNIFFIYGGRPEINNLPVAAQLSFQALIAIVSSLWLYRTWGRSQSHYQQESLASKRLRQLKKLSININELLNAAGDSRSIEQLSAEEINILTQTLPHIDTPHIDTLETNTATPAATNPSPKNNNSQKALPCLLPKTIIKRTPTRITVPKTPFSKANFPKTQRPSSSIPSSPVSSSSVSSSTVPKTDFPKTSFPETTLPQNQVSPKQRRPQKLQPKTALPKTIQPKTRLQQ